MAKKKTNFGPNFGLFRPNLTPFPPSKKKLFSGPILAFFAQIWPPSPPQKKKKKKKKIVGFTCTSS